MIAKNSAVESSLTIGKGEYTELVDLKCSMDLAPEASASLDPIPNGTGHASLDIAILSKSVRSRRWTGHVSQGSLDVYVTLIWNGTRPDQQDSDKPTDGLMAS